MVCLPRAVTSGGNASTSDPTQMSPYEAQAWANLGDFWQRKADRRSLPPKANQAKDAATAKLKGAASATGGFISSVTPQPVKNAGGMVVDWAWNRPCRPRSG